VTVDSVKGKRVIVTGGAGVIGRELLKLLADKNANVLSVDREPLPIREPSGIRHIKRDLASDDLDELIEFQPQFIFHLAATFERSAESPEFWEANWHDNVIASHRTISLINAMKDLEIFIFASSYLVYSPSLYLRPSPVADIPCLKEESLKAPRNLCGAAKLYTEKEIDFAREYCRPSLRAVNARIYRVYGHGSKDIISRWIRAALSGEDINVYNRQNRFDYIFAFDVAQGLLTIAQSSKVEGVINLGSGVSRSIQEVLDILCGLFPGLEKRIKDMRDIEQPFEASCADLAKLKELTGWAPPTSLEEGIRAVLEFEKG